jgi:phosphatidylglycerophosphatase A
MAAARTEKQFGTLAAEGAISHMVNEQRFGLRRFVASGFSVGLIPRRLRGDDRGAGTFGAALAAAVSILLLPTPWWTGLIAFAVALALSMWSAAPFAADHQDPGWVVVDEIAGTLLALIGLSGWPWVVALVVARAADIFKVLPGVRPAESLPGALGVTMDDVVAGGYGLIAGWLVVWLF